ncbi:MAG TPA: antitoxin VapB family protein [Thermoplasmata archaeon]|nr:antitoxin VapB family protein [Thermoplasmata archaeon]
MMAGKTVALDTEAYALLRQRKRPGETFSEVVRRELRPPARILDLAGSLRDVDAKVWRDIARERQAHDRSDRRRMERLGRPRRAK